MLLRTQAFVKDYCQLQPMTQTGQCVALCHTVGPFAEALRHMQVVARHPLGLRSLWDERIADGNSPEGETAEQLFTTWKIRTDGQAQRVIDYIWCVRA